MLKPNWYTRFPGSTIVGRRKIQWPNLRLNQHVHTHTHLHIQPAREGGAEGAPSRLVDCDKVKAGAANLPADAAEAQFLSKFKLTAQSAAGEGSKKQRTCDMCGKASHSMQKCGRCREARYCSAACQASAWKEHKKVCVKAA